MILEVAKLQLKPTPVVPANAAVTVGGFILC